MLSFFYDNQPQLKRDVDEKFQVDQTRFVSSYRLYKRARTNRLLTTDYDNLIILFQYFGNFRLLIPPIGGNFCAETKNPLLGVSEFLNHPRNME